MVFQDALLYELYMGLYVDRNLNRYLPKENIPLGTAFSGAFLLGEELYG